MMVWAQDEACRDADDQSAPTEGWEEAHRSTYDWRRLPLETISLLLPSRCHFGLTPILVEAHHPGFRLCDVHHPAGILLRFCSIPWYPETSRGSADSK